MIKSENKNTMAQNLYDAAKGALRGKIIAIQAYLKDQEISQINNLKYTQKIIGQRENEAQSKWKFKNNKYQSRNN